MGNFNDNATFNIKGEVTCYKTTKGITTKEFSRNIVVNNARQIVRDLVFGKRGNNPAPTIKYLVLGDANLENKTESAISPTINDSTLTNPTLWIPLEANEDYPNNTIEAKVVDGLNAIEYKVVIGRAQGNTDKGFFAELGLAIDNTLSEDAYLFTKLTKTFEKTADDEIVLLYRLTF